MIINKIAMIINNMIIKLYSMGISFYQVLLGLFIFNILVYIVIKIILEMKKVRY